MSTRRPNHAARHIFSVGRVIFTSILKNINASRYIVTKFDSSFVIKYDTAGTRAQRSYPVLPRPARRTALLIPNGVVSVVALMAFPADAPVVDRVVDIFSPGAFIGRPGTNERRLGGSKISVVVPLSRDYSNLHAGPLVSLRKGARA